MKLSSFATVCFINTVNALQLQSFPSYEISQNEQIEFAQSFDEVAFGQMLSAVEVNDNVPISNHDFLMQSMSETDADIMTTILANVEANAQALAWTEADAEAFAEASADAEPFKWGGMKERMRENNRSFMHNLIGARNELTGGASDLVHGNISQGTMKIFKSGVHTAGAGVAFHAGNISNSVKTTVNVTQKVGETAIIGISTALEIGGDAFNALIAEAIRVGDIVTAGIGKLVQDIVAVKDQFIDLMKWGVDKYATPENALKLLKMLPVVGDIATAAEHVYRIGDRAINGESELCYRTGWELRKFRTTEDGECASPGNLIHSQCILPCAPGKSSAALLCLDNCPSAFPHNCGTMCTATEKLCKGPISQTIDVVNAGLTIAKTAGDIASGNVLGFFSKALSLVDSFAHPFCVKA